MKIHILHAQQHQILLTKETSKLIWVNLSLVLTKRSGLLKGIRSSLRCYEKNMYDQRISYNGIFEGQVIVLLDICKKKKEDTGYKNLQTMLYLPFWDRYVPAFFKGVLPVCNFYKQAGHIAK